MRDWQRDLSDSAFDFLRVVWPAIRCYVGGGDLVPVEAVKAGEFNRQLDILAGIDAWQVDRKGGRMRGIASRVQWGKAWQSFTIRCQRDSGQETELAKRMKALDCLEEGWLYPALTVQAYVETPRTGKLLSVGWIRTRELMRYIRENPKDLAYLRSNADFCAAFWGDIYLKNYGVTTLPTLHVPTEFDDDALEEHIPEEVEVEWHKQQGGFKLFD